jgi:pseudouridine-5'-phosphate glycosidase
MRPVTNPAGAPFGAGAGRIDHALFEFTPAVREALHSGLPVVALESTIITHGMPAPANLETARQAEQAIRDAGATPATIALLDGRVRIGLRGRELERLADEAGGARKCSLRDLSLALSSGQTGGTTVAATLHLAKCAGIPVFATGGIGGVHRNAQSSMDISADLPALANSSLAVVCAGPKAILDLGLTLEYLETLGVPVLGYQTDQLPAFWCRDSGFAVDQRVDSAAAAARILGSQRALGLPGGVLLCNPLAPEHALPLEQVETAIAAAMVDAAAQCVAGKALTPFLLQRVMVATGGDSLAANQALMRSNAKLAAELACALAMSQPAGD